MAPGPGDTAVSVTLSSYALVGVGSTDVYSPGETVTRTLHAGDVFQILSAGNASVTTIPCDSESPPPVRSPDSVRTCKPDRRTDLTGSRSSPRNPSRCSSGTIARSSPTTVTRRPATTSRSRLFPSETWGTRYAVSPTAPQLTPPEPTWVRVLSNADGNLLTITPPVAGAPAMLDRGDYFDFSTVDGVLVEGTGAFLVAQYMVGQNYWSNDDSSVTVGADPDMALEVPIEQWRSVYDFYVPTSYVSSYLNAVVSRGATPMLDGHAPTAYARVPLGPYDVLQIDVSSTPGPHHLEADEPFALKVYGFAPYTSYLYVGGLDLRSNHGGLAVPARSAGVRLFRRRSAAEIPRGQLAVALVRVVARHLLQQGTQRGEGAEAAAEEVDGRAADVLGWIVARDLGELRGEWSDVAEPDRREGREARAGVVLPNFKEEPTNNRRRGPG